MEPNNDDESNVNQIPVKINVDISTMSQETVQQMTHGFVHYIEKELDQVQNNLKEALTKQEKMGIELERLNSDHAMESRQDCQDLFYMVKECTDKLHLIKKRMINMHQRVKRLKKRSDCLLKYRDKELTVLRQKQLQEEELIAKTTLKQQMRDHEK